MDVYCINLVPTDCEIKEAVKNDMKNRYPRMTFNWEQKIKTFKQVKKSSLESVLDFLQIYSIYKNYTKKLLPI